MDSIFRIFVVDDEELVRQGIALALGGDFQVSAFETAEAALEGMRGDSPDLVLLDI
ncbi:MAG: response regulator, partial [Deltaproteobacteria bacterium]|nr:response regulator [Deltaproteobacteria bacterium]